MKEKDFLKQTIENAYPTEAPDLDANEVLSRSTTARVKSRGFAGVIAVLAALAVTVGAVAVFSNNKELETSDSEIKAVTSSASTTTASKTITQTPVLAASDSQKAETTTTTKASAAKTTSKQSSIKTVKAEKKVNAQKKTTATVSEREVEETSVTTVPVGSISSDQAVDIALDDSGLTMDKVTGIEYDTDNENGRDVFEVELTTANAKYEYKIDIVTGEIVDRDTEQKKVTSTTAKTVTTTAAAEPDKKYISADKAREAALKIIGISEKDAHDIECESDTDGGKKVYEVDIDVLKGDTLTEYDIKIDALSGEVISSETETSSVSADEDNDDDDDFDDDDDDDFDDDDDDDVDDD
ncbi:MAG: PepSY domain-containing protein [Ruminococcus sp.]|nr:PepSY domain-containing protein [Ruminococcus sp.]